MKTKFVAYYRVSTIRQGKSKLGLEAQREIVKNHLTNNADSLAAEYTEIESGRNNKRPELAKALKKCKEIGATLVVAKLDRLARNVGFIFALKEAGTAFIACDLPDFNTLTLGIFASFAQYEAEKISSRIKDALKARKARGLKHPSPKTVKEGIGKLGNEKRLANNREYLTNAYNTAKVMRKAKSSLYAIMNALNNAGLTTVRGKKFTITSVKNMFCLFEC